MKRHILSSAILLSLASPTFAADGDIHDVTILGTSDIHGHFMAWDYAADKLNTRGSLSQIATKVGDIRKEQSNIILSMLATPSKATSLKPSKTSPLIQ